MAGGGFHDNRGAIENRPGCEHVIAMGGDPLLVERVAKRGGLLRRQRDGLAPASAAVHTFRDADHRVWGIGGIPVEGKYQRVDASLAVEGHRGVSAVLPLEAVATGRA